MRELIFLPVLLQVLVTFYAYILLAAEKSKALKAGLVNEARRSLHVDAWPDCVVKINNNVRNQFELPVLFYVLVFLLWALDSVGLFVQVIAWLFALSRVVHVYIHTGSNYVPVRRRVFIFGVVTIAILVVIAIVRILSGLTFA